MKLEKLKNPDRMSALLQGAPQLLSLFAPQKQTTGSQTETTKTDMSQEGLDAVLRQILESNQGLSSVARGQRQAGLYNSSVNTLLTNDLITRAAGDVARINAPVTRITSGRTDKTEAPLSLGKSLGTIAGGTLLKSALKSDTAKSLGNSVVSAVKNAFSGGGKESGWVSGFDLPMGDMNPTSWVSGFDLGSGGIDMGGFNGDWVSGFDVGGIDFGGMSSSGPGLSEAKAIFDIFSSDDKGAAAERAIGQAVGSYFGGPVGGAVGAAVAEPVFEAGYDVLGVAEDAFYDVLNPIEGFFKDVGKSVGCFITTATVNLMGKEDNCDELETLRAFRDTWLKDNHPEDIEAYYETAPKILTALSSSPKYKDILSETYTSYILPSVEAVKAGENDKAYQLYKNMVLMLSKAAGLPIEKETT